VRDRPRVARLVAHHDLDAVCHLAALVGDAPSWAPLAHWDVNLGGTLALLEALDRHARRTGRPARLVFASSGAVYGDPGAAPVPEGAPARPLNPYGASKLAAEQAIADQARTGRLGAVVIRHFNAAGAVDGVHDTDVTRLIPGALAVAKGLRRALPRGGPGVAVREFTHVGDLAEAFLLALDRTAAGTARAYNVGSGEGVTIRAVLDLIAAAAGRALPRDRTADPEPPVLVADSTRARRELGWRPRRSSIDQIVTDAWRAAADAGD